MNDLVICDYAYMFKYLCMKDYYYILKQDQLSCDKCDNMAVKTLQIHIECVKQVFIYLELS